jgi:hypothetical protein
VKLRADVAGEFFRIVANEIGDADKID